MSRSKINELLSRARQISNEAERIEKSQSPIIGVRPSTRLSSSFQKKSPSPVSQTSFLSNEDRSPIIEHPSNRTYRNIGIKKHSLTPDITKKKPFPQTLETEDSIVKVHTIVEEIAKNKLEFCKQIEKHVKFEDNAAENLITNLKNQKKLISQDPKIKLIEEKYKKKNEQILEIFKLEALKTDNKLKTLRNENDKLKSIISNPQLPQSQRKRSSLKDTLYALSLASFDKNFNTCINELCNNCKESRDVLLLEVCVNK